ncbi:hypothetical protein [Nitrospirillum sp. BR 11163]|uniref:hypothetical protein n=1 Tax=Nitrospirillum sp. BR 11163 TaxID=3104323 RepID=UPI002AFEEA41|nr:hypothetical protein [Nitrospirillum sp. BR 11163]MEA1673978.1 hypothetical protein [Nitrospirillum sp. BR 11163]
MSSNDQAIEKIWWQLCLNSTSLYRSALGPITKSEMISLGRRSIASSEVTSSVISSQKSAEDILDDTHTLIDAINKNGNFFKIIEISKNDKLGGLIFVHPHHQQLAESGHIAEVENTPLSNYRIKYPARSTIILTLDMLKTIEDPENLGTPAFPALETYFSEYDEELLSDVYYDFPDLLPRGESKIAEIYRRSAKHMFTHGRRAEILWGFLADRIGPSDKYFRSISPSITMANGTDGGIDDLRTTATGALLATQVKGGKTWGKPLIRGRMLGNFLCLTAKASTSGSIVERGLNCIRCWMNQSAMKVRYVMII